MSDDPEYGTIDIHAHDDYLFRLCCEHGHLEIAQYLYYISCKRNDKINIHAMDDEAYCVRYHKGHSQVASWLLKLSTIGGAGKIEGNLKIPRKHTIWMPMVFITWS